MALKQAVLRGQLQAAAPTASTPPACRPRLFLGLRLTILLVRPMPLRCSGCGGQVQSCPGVVVWGGSGVTPQK